MQQQTALQEEPPEHPRTRVQSNTQAGAVSIENDTAILDLLGDTHTQTVIQQLLAGPHTAAEIRRQTDISKATVYRRLNELDEAGLLTTDTRVDTKGHHRTEYSLAIDSFTIRLDNGTIALTANTAHTDNRAQNSE